MEAMLGIFLYSYLYFRVAKKCYVFLMIAYVFSSTKLEKKRKEQVLSGSKRGKGRGRGGGQKGRDGSNNVCTYA
jgi:hypothetical protein